MIKCLYCHKILTAKYSRKYCSNKCQNDHIYNKYIERWRLSKENGSRGIKAKNISGHIVRYIFEKYHEKCAICGWCEKNGITNRVTLEIDHVDGNSENNNENNLILLCPNCHSLTPSYKNLNKGYGRLWRREKYVRIDEVPT